MEKAWILAAAAAACVGRPQAAPAETEVTSVLSRVAIVVTDLERSKQFYTQGLGYRVTFEGDIGDKADVRQKIGLRDGQRARFVVLSGSKMIGGKARDGAMVGLLQVSRPAPAKIRRHTGREVEIGETMFAIRTDDVAAVYTRMQKLGAVVLLPPLAAPDGSETELVVRDPDGTRLHIVQRTD